MASLKIVLKGLGEFGCTGKKEFISSEIEKFYSTIVSSSEQMKDDPVKCVKPEGVKTSDSEGGFCEIQKITKFDPELSYAISMMQKGELTFDVGDIITIPLRDGTKDSFVMTQEDDEAYRFESVACVGGSTITRDKVDDLFEQYYNLLPKVITDNLLLTTRKYRDRNDVIKEGESILFLPSAPEVFPKDEVYGDKGLYEQMEWYKDRRHRMRKLTQDSEDTVSWWLMSASAGATSNFCDVYYYGNANTNNASATWIGAPVCFRIRKRKSE